MARILDLQERIRAREVVERFSELNRAFDELQGTASGSFEDPDEPKKFIVGLFLLRKRTAELLASIGYDTAEVLEFEAKLLPSPKSYSEMILEEAELNKKIEELEAKLLESSSESKDNNEGGK